MFFVQAWFVNNVCVFLEESRWDHKRQMTVRERDEIENENQRETLSKHGRRTRRQEHPYLLCRGWDSQTAGQVCLLFVWSVTPCHIMCYVDFCLRMVRGRTTQEAFVCQNASFLLCVTLKCHEQDSHYSEHHFVYSDQLNKACLAVITNHLGF